jgi:predicted RNase H-like HicB family nuclease
MTTEQEIRLQTSGNSDFWTAVDVNTGVASQGRSRQEALTNLDEAVEGYRGAGRPPTQEELRELGIEPYENETGSELPDLLK